MHQVLCLKYSQKDVAREHRVTQAHISTLVTKAQKNKKFLEEIIEARAEKEHKQQKIKAVVTGLCEEDKFIDSIGFIRKELKEKHDIVATAYEIRPVLR